MLDLPIFMLNGTPEPQPQDTNEFLLDDDLSFAIVQVTLLTFLGTNSKLLCNSGLQKGSEDSNVCVAGDCILHMIYFSLVCDMDACSYYSCIFFSLAGRSS